MNEQCPFDTILARTPYLVLPKLAIQSMSMEWRKRLEQLLTEAEDAGIETPAYYVFRAIDGNNSEGIKGVKNVSEPPNDPFYRFTGGFIGDPWANYRYGKIEELCPNFEKPETSS